MAIWSNDQLEVFFGGLSNTELVRQTNRMTVWKEANDKVADTMPTYGHYEQLVAEVARRGLSL